jgi:hypothetical protein
LNLTVNQIDTTLSVTGNLLSSNQSGAQYQWLNCSENYSSISSATQQNYTAVSNGEYAVELTHNGCTDTSECKAVTSIGVVASNASSDLVVFPNPTQGKITVQFISEQSKARLTVVNSLGKIIYENELNNVQTHDFGLVGVDGVYYVIVATKDSVERFRVVKGK